MKLLITKAKYYQDAIITNIRTVILEKQKQYYYEPPSVNTPNLISFDTLCPVTVEEMCKTIHDLYHLSLGEICRRHGAQYYLYVDDTQLYVSFKVGDAVDPLEAQRWIEMCIAEIKAWMVMFMLKLNDNKTKLVVLAPPYFLQHNKVPLPSVQMGDM